MCSCRVLSNNQINGSMDGLAGLTELAKLYLALCLLFAVAVSYRTNLLHMLRSNLRLYILAVVVLVVVLAVVDHT